MKERIFNLFLYIHGPAEIIEELGVVPHTVDGTDAEKLKHLQAAVESDHPDAKRYPVSDRYAIQEADKPLQRGRITYATFRRKIDPNEFFEEVFADYGAGPDPLMCVTCIVEGKPVIDKHQLL
jgi:hypothetical protein